MGRAYRIAMDAFWRFNDDDGWAIASHIALSALMSLFPFLIVVTALAAFFGTKELADETARLMLEAWPKEVAGPIAGEIRDVLTNLRTDILTFGVLAAVYFSTSGIDSLRIGLNRAYGVKEPRPWWWLRLESIFYVLVGAAALLAFSFLIVLWPLLWATAVRFFPALPRLDGTVTLVRYGFASAVIVVTLVIVHLWLPAGRRGLAEIAPGNSGDARALARGRRRVRPLPRRFRLYLRDDLRGPCVGHDRARVPLSRGVDLRVWRRAECGDRARAG